MKIKFDLKFKDIFAMGNTTSDKKFLKDWSRLEKEGSPGTFTNVWVQKNGNKKI